MNYESDVVLRDGSTLHVRSVQSGDRAALGAFFRDLSPESFHFRFFTAGPTADREVDRLLTADTNDVALVGETGGRLVGVASSTRVPAPAGRAEVAFAVADAAQGRGVGTRLLESLADVARAAEIRALEADVLGDNARMLRVFEDSGFVLTERFEDGMCHVVLSLEATADLIDRSAARAEAAAAASMAHVFAPDSVVVIGASRSRDKIGSAVLRNIIAAGFAGQLYVVHPAAAELEGVRAYPTVEDLPDRVALAVIAVPADQVLAVLDACIAKGVAAVVVISAGFSEVGAEGHAREAALVRRVRDAGIRLVGPNCMGVINTSVHLNATFAPSPPPSGRVALSTQSGALGFAILDYANQLGIGFSTFISVGNKADVSGNDLIQYWAQDPNTDVILLYLESFGNPRKFTQIARRVARRKPIVAVKAGRSQAGARAASSHTGALAADDAVVDALFHQAGIIRTRTLEELFGQASLLAHQPVPKGRRVAILTNAGGPGILAADACEGYGLTLPPLADATVAALRQLLPPTASVANPVDMIASATAAQYEGALRTLLADDGLDAVIAIFIPPLVTAAEDVAQAIASATAAVPGKPVAAVWMSTAAPPAVLAKIPTFRFPEPASVALARAAAYGEWLSQPVGAVPAFSDIDRNRARAVVAHALGRGGGWLSAQEIQDLFGAVGLPLAPGAIARREDEAVAMARQVGYPVVLKALGPDIVHKTEVRGIHLNLEDDGDVRHAWQDLQTRLGDRFESGLVQPMIAGGVEMLLGVVDDPTFGHVLACATGGTLTELMADSQVRLHPLTDRDATDMIERLRGARLLDGYRGQAPADRSALRDALLRLSTLVTICPEISELDINPFVVLEAGGCALDVRVALRPPRPRPATRRIAY